jgi:hypothetical protein
MYLPFHEWKDRQRSTPFTAHYVRAFTGIHGFGSRKSQESRRLRKKRYDPSPSAQAATFSDRSIAAHVQLKARMINHSYAGSFFHG